MTRNLASAPDCRFQRLHHVIAPTVLLTAAYLWLLPSLGNGMLWQDEAQTALLGAQSTAFPQLI